MSGYGRAGRPVRAGREPRAERADLPTGPSTRRSRLEKLQPNAATHAGLWLDKYIHGQDKGDTENRRRLVAATARIAEPPLYRDFYARWEAALRASDARMHEATVRGRMVVGTGAESVLETAITLHRTYGVPYIPGSALKGLAATYARTRLESKTWDQTGEAFRTLFGATASGGYVTFYDALYVPGSAAMPVSGAVAGQGPLQPDVLTVHHRGYYSNTNNTNSPPADWDSPVPVPFLSATGRYLVALAGPEAWVTATFDLLGRALDELGVGAKTSSGYGRLTMSVPAYIAPAPADSAAVDSAERETSAPLPPARATAHGVIKNETRKQGRRNLNIPYVVDAEDKSRHRIDWRELRMDALKDGTPVEYEYTSGPDDRRTVVAVRKIPKPPTAQQ